MFAITKRTRLSCRAVEHAGITELNQKETEIIEGKSSPGWAPSSDSLKKYSIDDRTGEIIGFELRATQHLVPTGMSSRAEKRGYDRQDIIIVMKMSKPLCAPARRSGRMLAGMARPAPRPDRPAPESRRLLAARACREIC